MNIAINEALVKKLIQMQFPKWTKLPIKPVSNSGWDNRTFHLGKSMVVRLPSAEEYAPQVLKEQFWLPKLAPHLSVSIPTPKALGKPSDEFPFHWSIYEWIPGDIAKKAKIAYLSEFARELAQFLIDLHRIDSSKGPTPGDDNFHRGGSLKIYDKETRKAIKLLKNKIDTNAALRIWDTALSSHWDQPPVWVHGDLSPGNLLIQDGKLTAVIDFGLLSVGDTACDLVIAWTFFEGDSRQCFQDSLLLDEDTWNRARGWALWKAVIIAAGLTESNAIETKQCWHVIEGLLAT